MERLYNNELLKAELKLTLASFKKEMDKPSHRSKHVQNQGYPLEVAWGREIKADYYFYSGYTAR